MNLRNALITIITLLCLGPFAYGQSNGTDIPPLSTTNNIQRLVNSEKTLNNRIVFFENELKQLKQKQAILRKKINEQIEVELKEINKIKDKVESENKKIKAAKVKKNKKYIERSEKRIQELKNLQEELKSNWKDS